MSYHFFTMESRQSRHAELAPREEDPALTIIPPPALDSALPVLKVMLPLPLCAAILI